MKRNIYIKKKQIKNTTNNKLRAMEIAVHILIKTTLNKLELSDVNLFKTLDEKYISIARNCFKTCSDVIFIKI